MNKTAQINYQLAQLRQEYKDNPERRWVIELQAKALKTALNAPEVISDNESKKPKDLASEVAETLL